MHTWKPIIDGSTLPSIGREESEFLDFKREAWDPGDKGYNELARDVAQFANNLGGSILIGAGEDGRDRLSEYINVPDAPAVAARVADVCHSALSPRADVYPVIVEVDAKDLVVVNVPPHDGFVANKLKGTERWEFNRRVGKAKKALSFEEVERMWTDGRRGRVLLGRIPELELGKVHLDVVEGRGIALSNPVGVIKLEQYFCVSLGIGAASFNFPYEFVRAVWPAAGGGWFLSLTVRFELNAIGEIRAGYSSR